MRDMQLVLERWGAWVASEGDSMDWSPTSGGFKSLLPNEGRSRPSCCDDDGIIIDTAVGMLRKAGRHSELDLIIHHYVYGESKYGIARRNKCSEGKIRNRLMIAETFIDACLIMSGATLEMDDWTHKYTTNETQRN